MEGVAGERWRVVRVISRQVRGNTSAGFSQDLSRAVGEGTNTQDHCGDSLRAGAGAWGHFATMIGSSANFFVQHHAESTYGCRGIEGKTGFERLDTTLPSTIPPWFSAFPPSPQLSFP